MKLGHHRSLMVTATQPATTNTVGKHVNTESEVGPARIASVLQWDPNRSFAETVQVYGELEAQLIAQAGADESRKLETKRQLAEALFVITAGHDGPFEHVQEAWNRLGALGFADVIMKQAASLTYAQYCLDNEHYDAGLGVIEPAIAEFERWLAETAPKAEVRSHYDEELTRLVSLRDELKAGVREMLR